MVYVLIIAAALIFWLVIYDRPVAKIEFKNGELKAHKGKITPQFKHDCCEIAKKSALSGTVKVYVTRSSTKLVFSKTIPNKIQQRIRNVYPHEVKSTPSKRKAKRK
ncbi:MAG: DUF3634 family protein [Aliivibrio sp.]|uniref:DUF3634 family protein n=1 Tax=Aliivibrio sp. TaxID=1872443 RepID=UPI001A3EA83D|nr:DUF3634 family protein [Aliivibrio sp.]